MPSVLLNDFVSIISTDSMAFFAFWASSGSENLNPQSRQNHRWIGLPNKGERWPSRQSFLDPHLGHGFRGLVFAEPWAGSDLQIQGLEALPNKLSGDVASAVSPTIPSRPHNAFTERCLRWFLAVAETGLFCLEHSFCRAQGVPS
jgi:hypothetical protein